jgi:hypothetical protein
MAKSKKNDTVEEETTEIVEEKIDPVVVVSEYVSADKSLKAVLKHNRLSSLYEIDFYKDKKKIATESYAFHTRRYHEDAAENYVNGIKKI